MKVNELDNHVFNYFTESIQTQIMIAETLNQPIEQIIEKLLNSLLDGKTIFITATGFLMPTMMNFTNQLFNGLKIDRPAISIVALPTALSFLTAFDHPDAQLNEAKQLSVFGKPKDILILLSDSGNEAHLVHCAKEAIEKEMTIILFRSAQQGELSALLGPKDIEIEIPATSKLSLIEMQTLILNCIGQTLEFKMLTHS